MKKKIVPRFLRMRAACLEGVTRSVVLLALIACVSSLYEDQVLRVFLAFANGAVLLLHFAVCAMLCYCQGKIKCRC